MSAFIFGLTLRELLFRRSTLLLAGLSMLPWLIGLLFKVGGDSEDDPEEFAVRVLCTLLIVTTVLPLTALLFGTSVLGDELEDGTVIYLLTKPVERWRILLPKIAAAWLLTWLLALASIAGAVLIVLGGSGGGIILGFAIGAAVGALAYICVFVLLSIVTSRALIAGLVFVFIWEGAVSGIFEGVRYLSIRHYVLGLADWLTDLPEAALDAYVGGVTALVLSLIVILVAAVYAERRLQRVEIREAT
jgi:ABC-2 type transport system permease protein